MGGGCGCLIGAWETLIRSILGKDLAVAKDTTFSLVENLEEVTCELNINSMIHHAINSSGHFKETETCEGWTKKGWAPHKLDKVFWDFNHCFKSVD